MTDIEPKEHIAKPSKMSVDKKPCKHTNVWIISGGSMLWCYECGAIRPNQMGKKKIYWQVPSYSRDNPALAKWYPALTWRNYKS